MPEFLTLLPPDEARELWLSHLPRERFVQDIETIEITAALGRVLAQDVHAPHPLPEFRRSTVDGYAVRAADTHGASDSLPAYLAFVGEVPMGDAPGFEISTGQCAMIHTGGMLPNGADAVVMLEFAQQTMDHGGVGPLPNPARLWHEIEILRAVADGENVIRVGEDVSAGQLVQPRGTRLRPAEIGGLMALGFTRVNVVRRVRVGLISTGDEVIDPAESPRPGQVRDVNSYTLGALAEQYGGEPVRYGIVVDRLESLLDAAAQALVECDIVIITAGSSASTRDMTADVIRQLGQPGVLVHGINTRPGKPTILGVCDGKAVIGLPGNPVSALVNGYLFVVPAIEKSLDALPRPRPTVQARLTVNLASQAGREDWWPVRLIGNRHAKTDMLDADPIFGKSNLIFTLGVADGLLRIPPDATGLSARELVEVLLL